MLCRCQQGLRLWAPPCSSTMLYLAFSSTAMWRPLAQNRSSVDRASWACKMIYKVLLHAGHRPVIGDQTMRFVQALIMSIKSVSRWSYGHASPVITAGAHEHLQPHIVYATTCLDVATRSGPAGRSPRLHWYRHQRPRLKGDDVSGQDIIGEFRHWPWDK